MTATARVGSELDPYETLGLLGVGGMAKVYAVRTPSGERLALKVLTAVTPALTERFFREARLQQRVHHDNVLPVLDVLEAQGAPALLMPLVVGPSLDVLLQNVRPTHAQSVALFREVVCGVAAIHKIGLVHRDLKPGNVLLDTKDGMLRVMVADFGLAKLLDDLAPRDPHDPTRTKTGAVLGTPAYMAPEQRADASRVDARADVWALGALLFELLTGHRPDTGDVSASADDPWRALAEHLLHEDPAQRPASAVELLSLLPQTEPLDATLLEVVRSLTPEPTDEPSLPSIPGNLPAESDAFVGRHEELSALAAAVAEAQIVSVTGAAGVGKTRLVLRYASVWRDDYPGGTWFCDLSAARDADGILIAVASALSVPLGKGDPAEQLGHAIAGRGRCLVLLDNAEQVAADAAGLIARWLDGAKTAHFLVTSRSALSLQGECCFPLSPLSLVEAEALFWRRARTTEPPTPEARAATVELVVLLDALPLAIELAAARVSVLSPQQILARMGARFRLLASPGRTDRHATLQAAIDWSVALLTVDERAALSQLSVFRGGCTEEAAQVVLKLGGTTPTDAVSALVRQSLVQRTSSEPSRITLLASIAEYASQMLGANERREVEERHGRYFASFGTDEAIEALRTHGGVARQRVLTREIDNLSEASRRAAARADGEVAVGAALAAWTVLERRGPFAAGIDLLEDAAACAAACASTRRAALLRGLGVARWRGGDNHGARTNLERALALYREGADRKGEGALLDNLGVLSMEQGNFSEAGAQYEAALNIHRGMGNRMSEGITLSNLGILYYQKGQMREACRYYELALAIHREVGHRNIESQVLGNLGVLHHDQGRTDEAHRCYEQALYICRETDNRAGESTICCAFGRWYSHQSRIDEACVHYETALTIQREMGNRSGEALALNNLAVLYVSQGRADEALTRYERALMLFRALRERPLESIVLTGIGNLYRQLGRLDDACERYEAALTIACETGNRASEGLALGNLGLLYHQLGLLSDAQERYERALCLFRELGNPRMEGIALSNLGRLHAEQSHGDESRGCFDAGERILREVGDLTELCELLAARAIAEHHLGDRRAAQRALDEAERLASSMGGAPKSEISRAITSARVVLDRLELPPRS